MANYVNHPKYGSEPIVSGNSYTKQEIDKVIVKNKDDTHPNENKDDTHPKVCISPIFY